MIDIITTIFFNAMFALFTKMTFLQCFSTKNAFFEILDPTEILNLDECL